MQFMPIFLLFWEGSEDRCKKRKGWNEVTIYLSFESSQRVNDWRHTRQYWWIKKTKISFHLIGKKQIQLDFVTSVALDCDF